MKIIYIISLIFCLASLHIIGQDELEIEAPSKTLTVNHFGEINGWECYQEFNQTVYEKHFPNDSLDDCQWILKAKKGGVIISFWGSCKLLSVEYQAKNAPFIIFSDSLLPHFGNILFVVRFDVDGPKLLFMTPFSWDVPFYYHFVEEASNKESFQGTFFATGRTLVDKGETFGVIGKFKVSLKFDLRQNALSPPIYRSYVTQPTP